MKIISIIVLCFLSLPVAQASLEGDYILISGQKLCPTGSISLKTIGNDRHLLFGSQHSWTLNLKDKSLFKEVVEEGCTYITSYEKTLDTFYAKTVRSDCPSVSENSLINEEIKFKNFKLTYKYEQTSGTKKKLEYTCTYNRSNK